MLIAMSLAAALFASPALASGAGSPAPVAFSLPPMIVNVSVAPGISPSFVSRLLEETDAIWRASGFTFVWRHAAREIVPYARSSEAGPYIPSTLRVMIGNDPGTSRDGNVPLGWIVFDDVTTPEQEIYLSHANAQQYMDAARGVVGLVDQMPITQRETLLGRVMGRALAHELGHYLLASKIHTPRGLMRANRTASELFSIDRRRFDIDPAQRRLMIARLRGESLVVRR